MTGGTAPSAWAAPQRSLILPPAPLVGDHADYRGLSEEMAERTAIEWAEATWNPVTGCTKVSPGCKFCYAERITERWGQKFTEIKLHPERLDQPLKWKKPRRIFVCSMSDLFNEEIPDDFIGRCFVAIAQAQQHTYQVLTKRPDRMRKLLLNPPMSFPVGMIAGSPLPNVWLGVSVENQEQADKRIPILLETPAAVRFVSVEPLLQNVDIRRYTTPEPCDHTRLSCEEIGCCGMKRIDWVIVGGESAGPKERALVHRARSGTCVPKTEALRWVRMIFAHCAAASVPFFFKQWGGPTPKSGGRMLDGRTWDEYPKT